MKSFWWVLIGIASPSFAQFDLSLELGVAPAYGRLTGAGHDLDYGGAGIQSAVTKRIHDFELGLGSFASLAYRVRDHSVKLPENGAHLGRTLQMASFSAFIGYRFFDKGFVRVGPVTSLMSLTHQVEKKENGKEVVRKTSFEGYGYDLMLGRYGLGEGSEDTYFALQYLAIRPVTFRDVDISDFTESLILNSRRRQSSLLTYQVVSLVLGMELF